MCGIAGILEYDPARRASAAEVRAMAARLAHRGPDGEGVFTAGPAGLGHRRLAIIDLRSVADQPMANEDGTLHIVFNGEIYNYRELRPGLEARGHVFRTESDTEVILHAYEADGPDCLAHLRGMFAFAIWDARRRSLFLARDRVGKKPLFYHAGPDRFAFASEAKALLATGRLAAEADPAALHDYLTLGYVPAPRSALRGIRKLPPAHWLMVQDGRLALQRYWSLRYAPKRRAGVPELCEALRAHLAEAVRLRLVSDVPLGAFLSGGIDSSAVVAAMAAAADRPVRTFAVGFDAAAFDERVHAQRVASRFGTEHTELLVKPSAVDLLPRLVDHYDEPFGDASAVPAYCIAELTRRHVTVVLNGDGGDEAFAGYPRYRTVARAARADVLPRALWRGAAALLRGLPARPGPLAKLHRVSEAMALDPARRYARWSSLLPAERRAALYTPDFAAATADLDAEAPVAAAFAAADGADPVDAALGADVSVYLPEDLLVKMDRASMAHGLEARSPFLDHVFMEFAAGLPAGLKLHGREKKWILRESLRGRLPDAILDRPKMGFSTPLRDWFRGELYPAAQDLLLAPGARIARYVRQEAVARMLAAHAAGRLDAGEPLWALLVLETWHRTVLEARPVAAAWSAA
ncbi:MAG: asparagine synthase (glutamine-hydrolyzing) [Candidatus Methylomirabilales bacterium]